MVCCDAEDAVNPRKLSHFRYTKEGSMKDLSMQCGKRLEWLKRWGVDVVALAMMMILGLAAYGKWFHPIEVLLIWERSIAVFEICFIIFLWRFRRQIRLWVFSALIFASWGGYATFWYQLELPCSCMGTALHIPTLYMISLDLLFVIASVCCAIEQGGSKKQILIVAGLLLISAIFGFFLAKQIYVGWVAGV